MEQTNLETIDHASGRNIRDFRHKCSQVCARQAKKQLGNKPAALPSKIFATRGHTNAETPSCVSGDNFCGGDLAAMRVQTSVAEATWDKIMSRKQSKRIRTHECILSYFIIDMLTCYHNMNICWIMLACLL